MNNYELVHLKPQRDAELVKQNAVDYFLIGKDQRIDLHNNPTGRLSVLGVVGPSLHSDPLWEEAVLMEIGVGHGRPYTTANGLKKLKEQKCFPPRHNWFFLTPEMYELIAPSIFQYLLERATDVVKGWKTHWDNQFLLSGKSKQKFASLITRSYYSKGHGVIYERPAVFPKRPAVRFSVSVNEPFIVDDIYWAELYGNPSLQYSLTGLSNYMDKLFSNYKIPHRRKFPKDWRRLKYFSAAMVAFERATDKFPHLKQYVLQKHLGPRHYFYPEIAEILNWTGEPIFEIDAADAALPDPPKRLQGLEVRVFKRTERFVIFDVFPPRPEDYQPSELEQEYDDDIPF